MTTSAPPTLPFNFGQQPANDAGDFHWGRQHRAYLTHCASRTTHSIHTLADACGYTNIPKFQRRRDAWLRGEGVIPHAFLDAMGVDRDMLEQCVALDLQEYEAALQDLPWPKQVIFKLIPAVYITRDFPAVPTMFDAYEQFQERVDRDPNPNFRVHILWPALKSITFAAGRPRIECYWPPTLRTIKQGIAFGSPPAHMFEARVC